MLAARGIQCDTTYPFCRDTSESAIHLLRECPFAKQIWRKVGIPTTMEASFNLEMHQWLKTNCLSSHDILSNGVPWKILFTFTMWNLWKHRNRVVFENSILNPRLHYTCIKQAVDYYYCIRKSIHAKRWSSIQVQWTKPGTGWCKLNTDGASLGNPSKASGGGVIPDHRGEWLKGFSRGIGSTTSVVAEFWVVRDGLLLAVQMGIPLLEIECDAKIVTNLLLSNLLPNRTYTPLLLDCRFLLTRFQQIKVNHTYWEATSCADAMARLGCLQQDNFVVFYNPPTPEISSFVNLDAARMYYVRRCASTMPNLAL